MPAFLYSARPAGGGDILSGEVDLKTKEDVLQYLQRQKLIPVSVRESHSPSGSTGCTSW